MLTTQKKRLRAALKTSKPRYRRPKRQPMQQRPLFGPSLQPVSAADIELWIATVAPRISPERRERYALAYDVAGKVARAKNAGQWPPLAP